MPAKKENVEKFLFKVSKTVDGAMAWKETVKKAQDEAWRRDQRAPGGTNER